MDQHSISLHFVKFILRSPSGLFILSMSNEMWNLLELFLQAFILLYLFIRSENVRRMSVLSGLIFPEANLIFFLPQWLSDSLLLEQVKIFSPVVWLFLGNYSKNSALELKGYLRIQAVIF